MWAGMISAYSIFVNKILEIGVRMYAWFQKGRAIFQPGANADAVNEQYKCGDGSRSELQREGEPVESVHSRDGGAIRRDPEQPESAL